MKKFLKNALSMFLILAMICILCPVQPSAAVSRKCYTISKGYTTVYSNTGLTKKYGTIYGSDEITVVTVTSRYTRVTYPISKKKNKTGYIRTSAILLGTSGKDYSSKAKIPTYKRPSGTSYGYISSGDKVTVLGKTGNYTQVKYPVGGGYKYAFITTNNANKYLYNKSVSSSVGHNPIGNLESVVCDSNDTITVTGWVFDWDDPNKSLDVHVYIGGPAGEGTFVDGFSANISRKDVVQAYPGLGEHHGFSKTIKVKQTGTQSVYVYGINVGAGSNIKIGEKAVKIKSANSVGSSTRPIPDGMYKLVSAINSKYVWDIDSASTADYGNLQLYEDNNSNAQKFNFTYDSDGYYKITNVNSGKAIDCTGGGSSNGTNICQYSSNNTAAQRWKLTAAENSSFIFTCKCNGKVMDVDGGVAANKRNIQMYQSNGSNAQKFKLVETERNNTITTATYYVTTKAGLILRENASTNSTKITTMPYGSKIQVYNISNGWAKVDYAGKTGYCFSSYISTAQPAEQPTSTDAYYINGINIGYKPGSYFTDNGQACTDHGKSGIHSFDNEAACNCICTYNGKSLGAVQCYGFARYVQSKLYGVNSYSSSNSFYKLSNASVAAGKLTSEKLKKIIQSAKVGAHLRTNKSAHSMIITNITDSGFSIIQCNGSNNNEYSSYSACRIGTYTYTWSSYVNSTYGQRGINFIEIKR